MALVEPPKPAAAEEPKGLKVEGPACTCDCPNEPNGLDVEVFKAPPAGAAPDGGGNKLNVDDVFAAGGANVEAVPPRGNRGVVVDPFGFDTLMAGAPLCAPKMDPVAGVVFDALGAVPNALFELPAWGCCCCCATPNPLNGLLVLAVCCAPGALAGLAPNMFVEGFGG